VLSFLIRNPSSGGTFIETRTLELSGITTVFAFDNVLRVTITLANAAGEVFVGIRRFLCLDCVRGRCSKRITTVASSPIAVSSCCSSVIETKTDHHHHSEGKELLQHHSGAKFISVDNFLPTPIQFDFTGVANPAVTLFESATGTPAAAVAMNIVLSFTPQTPIPSASALSVLTGSGTILHYPIPFVNSVGFFLFVDVLRVQFSPSPAFAFGLASSLTVIENFPDSATPCLLSDNNNNCVVAPLPQSLTGDYDNGVIPQRDACALNLNSLAPLSVTETLTGIPAGFNGFFTLFESFPLPATKVFLSVQQTAASMLTISISFVVTDCKGNTNVIVKPLLNSTSLAVQTATYSAENVLRILININNPTSSIIESTLTLNAVLKVFKNFRCTPPTVCSSAVRAC
jgi:hypothetical protein